MKKLKIVGITVSILLLGGLIIFASVHTYDDSHLRVEGIRVKVGEFALLVDECDKETETLAYCKKNIEVNGENQVLEFKMLNFKENGFPRTITASINGKEFYKKDNLNLETNDMAEYQIFLNFKAIDDYIIFTLTDGTNGRNTTLYAIDTEGNIVLQEKEIDKNDMLIKDYVEFLTYDKNNITVYATRIVDNSTFNGKSICEAKKNDIVEAYYTYTLKNGKFTKKQTKTINASTYIKDNEINCSN